MAFTLCSPTTLPTMHPRALVDITAELLHEFRNHVAPADRALAKFLKQRSFLGSHDRRFISEAFYQTLRHLIRYDEAIRQSLENAPWHEWVSPAIGFPSGDPEALACWQQLPKPEPPKPTAPPRKASTPASPWKSPTVKATVAKAADNPAPWSNRTPKFEEKPLDRWIDSLRVALAADELTPEDPDQPPFWAFVEETFLRDWTLNENWHQGEWVTRLLERTRDTSTRLRTQPKRNQPNSSEHQYSVPQWLMGVLAYGIPITEHAPFYQSLLQTAPVAIRVNTLKNSREDYLQLLREDAPALDVLESDVVPDALILARRVAHGALPGEHDGLWEFQDIGSQLISTLLNVRPGIRVLDVCAGGGGKSLHLAALMDNRGEILLHDKVPRRLVNGVERCKTAGVKIAKPLEPDFESNGLSRFPDLTRLKNALDLLLIDAPCSGLGTLRRSPELKLRLNPQQLGQVLKAQQELLTTYAPVVRKGGLLAYCTCSFLREENEDQIERFLAAHPDFKRRPFTESEVPDPTMITKSGDLRLYPHRHDTDGFALFRLERI